MTANVVRVVRAFDFGENVSELYLNLCCGLSELPPPWGLKNVDILPLKIRTDWHVNGVSYRLRGEARRLGIGFANRGHRWDTCIHLRLEDYVIIEFNAARKGTNLKFLFDQTIPTYIRIFGAFYASVEDLDVLVREDEKLWQLSDEEHNLILSQKKSRREGCTYIWQVNYWAREQCNNYFGLTPEQVVNAVKGQVARADVLEGGAYIVVSYDPMSTDEVELITPKLMPLLRK